jgi:hypothetical protein
MRMINELTVVIKKKSFPGFVDELCKRECDILELQYIEDSGDGCLYTMRIASNTLRRFEEFITIIGSAGDRYRVISVKNLIEERVTGGLIRVTGSMPVENAADFDTAVLGAADFIRERIAKDGGAKFSAISRNVGLLCGVGAADEAGQARLLTRYVNAERDAVILNRFTGLNGIPLAVRFDHPEDVVKVLKRTECGFSAFRIMGVDEATMMLFELIFGELSVPAVSIELDDIPLLLLACIIKVMLKYRLKADEATVGFVGVDLSAVRLTRVLDKIGFRRVLGYDHGEKSLLALENQGGLATTAENIFGNADITLLMKNNFDHEEYRKIRPGQFVISLLGDEGPGGDADSGKGVREFITPGEGHLAALFPGIVRGVIDAGIGSISDVKLVECAKKLVGLLSDSFEFPSLFGDVHEKVRAIIAAEPPRPAGRE